MRYNTYSIIIPDNIYIIIFLLLLIFGGLLGPTSLILIVANASLISRTLFLIFENVSFILLSTSIIIFSSFGALTIIKLSVFFEPLLLDTSASSVSGLLPYLSWAYSGISDPPSDIYK